ncbi:hypothetical protein TRAPUB_14249 [Trametes pubescens]|uniref:Fungal-type protein kinase domain-containing protein n=1 Tax=Trametes pubescens TaxID=154538 RepID=A0A1M2VP44_TRAPU|nr:hypothetical protein TRAPUB_14249 [Trametes pubescens]
MATQPPTVNDPATASAPVDPADVDIPMTSAQDPTPSGAESAQPPKRAHRVRAVHARNLDTISGGEELIASIACAIDGPPLSPPLFVEAKNADGVRDAAHREIYEHGTAQELHGDINPNSILIFDHPPRPAHSPNSAPGNEGEYKREGGENDAAPWDSPYGPSAGAMVYWEPPISLATLRLVGNPDEPQPPPAWKSERYRCVMPPWDAGWRVNF